MMLRWISSVPPAMDTAGTDTSTSATIPSRKLCSPVSSASVLAISAWATLAARARLLAASLASDPSGPGARPSARDAFARAVEADPDGETDAADRLDQLDGIEFDDLEDDDLESDLDDDGLDGELEDEGLGDPDPDGDLQDVDLKHDDHKGDNAEGDDLDGDLADENEADEDEDDTGESTPTAFHPG